jgi:hypothetical protein
LKINTVLRRAGYELLASGISGKNVSYFIPPLNLEGKYTSPNSRTAGKGTLFKKEEEGVRTVFWAFRNNGLGPKIFGLWLIMLQLR